jgi:predicted DNA-binding protein (MmcQ/YjbR family)
MTIDDFRKIALNFPEAEERVHMNHPDFRVNGKIFATLSSPNADFGMVKISPEQQESYVAAQPKMFRPVAGAWGRQGCTHVLLGEATTKAVKPALGDAWQLASTATPKKSRKRRV